MAVLTPGFHGRPRSEHALPPGQYEVGDFPVLSAGPTPRVPTDTWTLSVADETGRSREWSWTEFMKLPQERPTVDLHCVTRWSKFGTSWKGVSVDTLFADVETSAGFVLVGCDGGYTTNLPVSDVLGGKAGSCTPTRARRSRRCTAVRPDCSCRISTSGSPPSGFGRSSSSLRTSRASGNNSGTTIAATVAGAEVPG